MSETKTDVSATEEVADAPIQTGRSSQAPAEGALDQSEQSDKTQGQSSEAPATG